MRRGKEGERDRFRRPESTPGRHSLTHSLTHSEERKREERKRGKKKRSFFFLSFFFSLSLSLSQRWFLRNARRAGQDSLAQKEESPPKEEARG